MFFRLLLFCVLFLIGLKPEDLLAKEKTGCVVPQPPTDAEVIFLSGYRGEGLSTVTVVGQDFETTVASIIIEEGEKPLYVFAIAYSPVIWDFSGATERLVGLSVQLGSSSIASGAGVHGVAHIDPTFVLPGACVDKYAVRAEVLDQIGMERLEAALSQDVDNFIISDNLEHLKIPSGEADEALIERDKRRWELERETLVNSVKYFYSKQSFRRSDRDSNVDENSHVLQNIQRTYASGIQNFFPSAIAASSTLEEYSVLPTSAGLAQLMADGLIREKQVSHPADITYVLEKPIPRIPGGLYGSLSVAFELTAGYSLPPGRLGHSRMVITDKGQSAR